MSIAESVKWLLHWRNLMIGLAMDKKPLKRERNLLISLVLGCSLTAAFLVLATLGRVQALGSSAAVSQAAGTVHYVAPGGDCGEASPCYGSAQSAADAAVDGDEIRVAAGTYTDVSERAGVIQMVYVDKSVTIRGGYTRTDWITQDIDANRTTLDAGGQGRVLYITAGISPTVEGLRITGGSAAGLGGGPTGEDVGGGAYVDDGGATISGCHVVNNTASWGGGLYVFRSSATVLNNRIEANEGLRVDSVQTRGGGLYLRGGGAVVAHNAISANRVTWDWGGGIYLYRSGASIQANQVTENVARRGGGGVQAYSSAPLLLDNLFSGNAAEQGGGLYLSSDSDGRIRGNDVLSNTANWGGGLAFYDSSASLTGNTVRSNSAQYGGGIFYQDGSGLALSESALVANSASVDGGALYLLRADVMLTNSLVLNNQAGLSGGGVQSYGGAMRSVHSTFAHNASLDNGSGIYLYAGSRAALTDTILVGHPVGIYGNGDTVVSLHATLWGKGEWANDTDWAGPGAIDHSRDYWGDPAFVDPEAGDYHISSTSAAIDRGVDAGVNHDIDGDQRPIPAGGGFDLGADEYGEIDLSGSRKSVHPVEAVAGDVLTYTIILMNRGGVSSRDTLLVDPIPTPTTYISGSAEASAGVVSDGESIRWSGALTPLQPVTITFSVTLEEQGAVIQNTAMVTDENGGVTTLWTLVNGWRYSLPLISR